MEVMCYSRKITATKKWEPGDERLILGFCSHWLCEFGQVACPSKPQLPHL